MLIRNFLVNGYVYTFSILLFLGLSNNVQAQNLDEISGTWDIIARRERSVLTIENNNGTLTGHQKSKNGDFELKNIKYDRNVLTYEMEIKSGENILSLSVDAVLNNSKISGVMKFSWQNAIALEGIKRTSDKKVENYKNLLGTWIFETSEGEGMMTFSIVDGKLKGVFENEETTLPLDYIIFERNYLTYKINYSGPDGNREIVFSAAIEGEKITGFLDFSWKNVLSFTGTKEK